MSVVGGGEEILNLIFISPASRRAYLFSFRFGVGGTPKFVPFWLH